MVDPPPPGINLNEDIRGTVIGPVVTLMTLATIFVVLRITSRLTTNLQLQWDDHLILLALVSSPYPVRLAATLLLTVGRSSRMGRGVSRL